MSYVRQRPRIAGGGHSCLPLSAVQRPARGPGVKGGRSPSRSDAVGALEAGEEQGAKRGADVRPKGAPNKLFCAAERLRFIPWTNTSSKSLGTSSAYHPHDSHRRQVT